MSQYQLNPYTEIRLQRWGHWCEEVLTWRLGYNSEGPLSRMMSSRGTLFNTSRSQILPENIEAEEMDYIVEQLGQQNSAAAKVLYRQYTEKGSTRQKAAMLDLDHSRYMRHLKEARAFVDNARHNLENFSRQERLKL